VTGISLANNGLAGVIPDCLFSLPLTQLSLANNALNGTQFDPRVLTSATDVHLEGCGMTALSGAFSTAATRFNIRGNDFSGATVRFTNAAEAAYIDVTGSNISGDIKMSSFPKAVDLSLARSAISFAMDAEPTVLKSLDVSGLEIDMEVREFLSKRGSLQFIAARGASLYGWQLSNEEV